MWFRLTVKEACPVGSSPFLDEHNTLLLVLASIPRVRFRPISVLIFIRRSKGNNLKKANRINPFSYLPVSTPEQIRAEIATARKTFGEMSGFPFANRRRAHLIRFSFSRDEMAGQILRRHLVLNKYGAVARETSTWLILMVGINHLQQHEYKRGCQRFRFLKISSSLILKLYISFSVNAISSLF